MNSSYLVILVVLALAYVVWFGYKNEKRQLAEKAAAEQAEVIEQPEAIEAQADAITEQPEEADKAE